MLTQVLSVSATHPEKNVISIAAKAIQEGKLVVFPTETVYGIAANALNSAAIKKLYAVKERPADKPFTWHIASMRQLAEQTGELSGELKDFLDQYWPGPLTVVLKVKNGTCGFRMPNHPVALALIEQSQVPVVAPSANLSGKKPPLTAQEALSDLNGKVELVLDSGPTKVQLESTVIDLTSAQPKILREGAISVKEIEDWFSNLK